MKNLIITGYINGTDINFIRELSNLRNLHGVLDLSEVNIVAGGDPIPFGATKYYTTDNGWHSIFLSTKFPFQKVILPKSLKLPPQPTDDELYSGWEANADTLIISSPKDFMSLYTYGYYYNDGQFVSLPEGVKTVVNCENKQILFPKSCTEILQAPRNVVIYAPWDSPIKAEYYVYSSDGGTRYYPMGTIYVPNGKVEAYKNSDFKNMDIREYGEIRLNLKNTNQRIFVDEHIPLEYSIEGWDEVIGWFDINSNSNKVTINFESKEIAFSEAGIHHVELTPRTVVPYFKTIGGTCDFQVYEHAESVDIPSNLNIEIGENKTITAVVKPIDKAYDEVTWNTSDSSIATIDNDGNVKGVSFGNCVITATTVDGGHVAECIVNVIQPIESINVTPKSLNLKVGESSQLSVSVLPSNANDKSVNWISENENIAKVDQTGSVTAVAGGNAKIFAISNYDNSIKDYCEITVIQPVTGIILNQKNAEINVDGSLQLIAAVLPENASNKNVIWSSSDVSVAMVSGNGTVYGIKSGQATIMATTEDGGFSALCKVIVKNILVSSILLSETTKEMNVGEEFKLTATILPENATLKNIEWKSTNESVATVNSKGVVNALGKGECEIIVSAKDESETTASCKISVGMNNAVEDIYIGNQENVMIYSTQGLLLFEGLYTERPLLDKGLYILKTITGKTVKLIINN